MVGKNEVKVRGGVGGGTAGSAPSVEREGRAMSGWPMLAATILGWVVAIAAIVVASILLNAAHGDGGTATQAGTVLLIVGIVLCVVMSMVPAGFFSLQPNEARVLVLFGEYRGTVRGEGFYWSNPFYSRDLQPADQEESDGESLTAALTGKKKTAKTNQSAVKAKISLRARTLNGPKLKVNDRNGNPIEIADVIVWRVTDTARAVFDVDHYEQFVGMQAETALRHVASRYAYDHNAQTDEAAAGEITLRSNIAEVSQALRDELAERLAPAGITVDDARLTHLAYAPEIAQVMLRRQQAEAIIAARTKIVQGAVSMVEMALKELDKDGVVELDEERKAAMVSNLMVVLCGDNDAQPVVNAGSLYN
ncbi:SPFH domain-containing protein [Bifidobacterium simiarum]|uniref:SPFH domain-containing protein n=1 Tax=Bifidobacterium simiarum TaxID=2045441 RepID=UPI001A9C5489|nr:SPFH domain-containing protein [Bifidobacterium simiarum]